MIDFDTKDPAARIKVIGVGGGGGNAINTMVAGRLEGVEFIAANTDVQALSANKAQLKLQLGKTVSRGLGAGANPDRGREAALEVQDAIGEVLAGADMVFVTAGMGGGTGTGAAPIIAEIARKAGSLTVGVVTKPFLFEGNRRRKQAESGIDELRAAVDTLIVIPNQRLLSVAGESMSLADAFKRADEVLLNAVQGISDLITVHGLVNVDFADVRTIMAGQGMALMGTGRCSGAGRAVEAMQAAISSPLLEDVTLDGATGLLVNITGGSSLTLREVDEAVSMAQAASDPDANIIFGSVVDERMGDEVKITVIATGFARAEGARPRGSLPRQVSLPVTTVASMRREIPPPLPASRPVPATADAHPSPARAMPARPVATRAVPSPDMDDVPPLPRTRPAPAVARATRDAGPYEVADEDQYDIPAFLRRNGGQQRDP
ncbi:MAG: cell division protein FtsZ [Deltaproteobacteria bacterium]